jgi:hypothetical protein
MRKLFLLLFLFTLSSNALAKVEIWECDLYGDETYSSLYKIDTSIPLVYHREDGKWIENYSKSDIAFLKYSSPFDEVSLYRFGERIAIFNMQKKTLIMKLMSNLDDELEPRTILCNVL